MNTKTIKIIKICFWMYILISFIVCTFNIISYNINSNDIIPSSYSYGIRVILSIISAIITVILNNLMIIIVYIAINIGTRKAMKNKLSTIDYKNDGTYFRDILKGYSSAELSYIDDFNIDNVNDISATLLELELKGVIKLNKEDNTIEIKEHNLNLSSNEFYVISNIKEGKLYNTNKMNYSMRIKEDVLKSGLAAEYAMGITKILTILFMLFFVFPASIITGINLVFNFMSEGGILLLIGVILIVLAMIVVMPFTIILIITYIYISIKHPYKRTKVGEEINIKLEGLKNYIKEYSNMQEKRTRKYYRLGGIFNIFNNFWTK